MDDQNDDQIDGRICSVMERVSEEVLHSVSEDSTLDLGFGNCNGCFLDHFEDVSSLVLASHQEERAEPRLDSNGRPQNNSEYSTQDKEALNGLKTLEEIQENDRGSGDLDLDGELPCLPPKKRRMLEHYQQESRFHGDIPSKSTQDDDTMDIDSPPQMNAISNSLDADLTVKEEKLEQPNDQGSCNSRETKDSGDDNKGSISSNAQSPLKEASQEKSESNQDDDPGDRRSPLQPRGEYSGLIPDVSALHEPGYLHGFRLAMSYLNKEGISIFMNCRRQDRYKVLCELSSFDLRHVESVQSRILDTIPTPHDRDLSTNERIYDKGCYRISRTSEKRSIKQLMKLPLIIRSRVLYFENQSKIHSVFREQVIMQMGTVSESMIESNLDGILRESISACFYDESSF